MNCFYLSTVHVQAGIPATGVNTSASGGSAPRKVGHIINKTILGSNGSMVQGELQPFNISVVSSVENTDYLDLRQKFSFYLS